MRDRFLCLRSALVLFLTAPCFAQYDIYDNGPVNGTVDAWTINFGFVVSDTFVLRSQTDLSAMTFEAWLFPGDVLESVEVSITSSEFGGTTYFDGVALFSQSGCVENQFGFDVCGETGSFGPVRLNAGTYWLNLQNAQVNTGNPVYWDENSGPSRASQNSVGTIPSEAFTFLGSAPPPTAPEPGSLLLLGSGVMLAIGARRRFS